MNNTLHPSVSRAAFAGFIQQCSDAGIQLHTVQLFEASECKIRWALAPYTCTQKREMYSISKSFLATAVGVAFAQGKLHPDDFVLPYFPEYEAMCRHDARWGSLRLRHLLSMTTGHAGCVMPAVAFAQDGVEAFFSAPLSHAPGSVFAYSTAASYLAAQLVHRATGYTVPQLLAKYVFGALGIDAFAWETCVDGCCQGGTGLSISSDDLVKLGLLYQNQGSWQGQQILTKEWVSMASAVQATNAGNGTQDWCAGYGFQFWKNRGEGFRGDGAFGQLCVVLPRSRQVAVITAECADMSVELDILWQLLQRLHSTDAPQTQTTALPNAYPVNAQLLHGDFDTGVLSLLQNPTGFTSLRLRQHKGKLSAFFGNQNGVQAVCADAAVWSHNALRAPSLRPAIFAQMPRMHAQTLQFAAYASSDEAGASLHCRSLNTPHAFQLRFTFANGGLQLQLLSPLNVFGEEKQITALPNVPC